MHRRGNLCNNSYARRLHRNCCATAEGPDLSISYTYTTLKAALQAWAEDNFEDFTDQLDDIIGKAELRCVRDLNLELFDQVDGSEVTTTADVATINLADVADGAFLLRDLWVNGAYCEPRSESFVYHYGDITSAGQPLYWCQVQDTTIRVAPTPDDAYSTRQILLRRPEGLSDTNATSFISTHAGDLLFAACKTLAEQFDKAPEDAAAAEAEYQYILPRAQRELKQLARKDYP